jgi:diaminohydroxyphosphoribosylaminopyrimidine deaminase/5-amino-6-(5-phosphoribosylamino)uracil reductase
MDIHKKYIERCITLASNGLGHTKSNPLVGCVIVNDEKIIGEGYHHLFGGKHAEVLAWENTGKPDNLENCDIYINLEPCAHIGKTGSCAQLLSKLNPKKVIISQLDPNPLVNGKGVEILKTAGIEVITGILENDSKFLNRRFNTFHSKQRPFIIFGLQGNGIAIRR